MAKLAAGFDYTDAEMLAFTREAYMKLMGGAQEYKAGGILFRAVDLEQIRLSITWLEKKTGTAVGSTAASGIGVASAAFGRAP